MGCIVSIAVYTICHSVSNLFRRGYLSLAISQNLISSLRSEGRRELRCYDLAREQWYYYGHEVATAK